MQIFEQKKIANHSNDFGMIAVLNINRKKNNPVPSIISRLWLQVLGQPSIPYENKQRGELIGKCKSEIGEYVNSWAAIFASQQKKSNTLQKETGSFPNFLNSHEIKAHLKMAGINRKVNVRKWQLFYDDKFYFTVYISYEKSEISQIYPQISENNNPFWRMNIDSDQLPEYAQVKKMLEGSNANAEFVCPKLEDDHSEEFDDIFETNSTD
jgi:hypothetical protein